MFSPDEIREAAYEAGRRDASDEDYDRGYEAALKDAREAITSTRYREWRESQEHPYSSPTWEELAAGRWDRPGLHTESSDLKWIRDGWFETTDRWLAALCRDSPALVPDQEEKNDGEH